MRVAVPLITAIVLSVGIVVAIVLKKLKTTQPDVLGRFEEEAI